MVVNSVASDPVEANPSAVQVVIETIDKGALVGRARWPSPCAERFGIILQLWMDGAYCGATQVISAVNGGAEIPFRLAVPEDCKGRKLVIRSAADGRIMAEGQVQFVGKKPRWQALETGIHTAPQGRLDGPYAVEAEVVARVGSMIVGWARSLAHPDRPVMLDVLADDEYIGSALADPARPLLEVGRKGPPRPGFFFDWLAPGRPLSSHARVSLRVAADDREVPLGTLAHTVGPQGKPAGAGEQDLTLVSPVLEYDRKLAATYAAWLQTHDASTPAAIAAARQSVFSGELSDHFFSVLVLGAELANADMLTATIRAIEAQIRAGFEIVLSDAAPEIAVQRTVKRVAGAGLADMLAEAGGQYAVAINVGDTIAPTALAILAKTLADNPRATLVYSDEDWIDGAGVRRGPLFKGSWDIDLALAQDYFCRLAAVPTQMLRSFAVGEPSTMAGFYVALLKWLLHSNATVIQAPFVLYHRAVAGAPSAPVEASKMDNLLSTIPAMASVRVHELPDGARRPVWPLPKTLPMVSAIIPTRDGIDLVRRAVHGILHETRYANVEVIVLDNDSVESESIAYFREISADPRVRVLPYPGAFNYSAANNFGVSQSVGELIALINNDIRVIEDDWLELMVRHAVRPEVGAVGARLLYADGRIQHGGVCLGVGGVASHTYKGMPGDYSGPGGRLRAAHHVEAVTGACMLLRRDVWDNAGGLDENLPVAFNDVDLCLKIRAAGFKIVLEPAASLYHLESASRGTENTPEKRVRFEQDKAKMIARWQETLCRDAYIGPNWALNSTNMIPSAPPRVSLPFSEHVGAGPPNLAA